jgi:hypothetical protein
VAAVPGAPSTAGGAERRNVAAELRTGAIVQLGRLPDGGRARRTVHAERPRRSPRPRVSGMPNSAIGR